MKVVHNGNNIHYINDLDEVDVVIREVLSLSPYQGLESRKIIDDTTLSYRLIVYEYYTEFQEVFIIYF